MGYTSPKLANAPKPLIEHVQSMELNEKMSYFGKLLWGDNASIVEWETGWNKEASRDDSTTVELFKVHDHVGPLFSESEPDEDKYSGGDSDFIFERKRGRPRFLEEYGKAMVEVVRLPGCRVDILQKQTEGWLGMSGEEWMEWRRPKKQAASNTPTFTFEYGYFDF